MRKAVTVALGTSYAFTHDNLPFEFFSAQAYNDDEARNVYIDVNIQRQINTVLNNYK